MLSQGAESSGSGGPVRWDSDSFPDVEYPPDYQASARAAGRPGGEAARDQPRPGRLDGQDGWAPDTSRGSWAGSGPRSQERGLLPQQQQQQAEGWSSGSGRGGNAGQPSRGGRQQDRGRGGRTEPSRGQGRQSSISTGSGWSTSSGVHLCFGLHASPDVTPCMLSADAAMLGCKRLLLPHIKYGAGALQHGRCCGSRATWSGPLRRLVHCVGHE